MEEKPAKKEGLFTKVRRESQERRAEADRRSAARRASDLEEINRQIAARQPHPNTKPVVAVGSDPDFADSDFDDDEESIKDQPA